MNKASTTKHENPRNLKQVQNTTFAYHKANRCSSGHSSKTNFADEMQQLCSKVADDDFIKGVFYSPTVILYTENQLCNLKHCCGSATADRCVVFYA